jgi:hypothetical protein
VRVTVTCLVVVSYKLTLKKEINYQYYSMTKGKPTTTYITPTAMDIQQDIIPVIKIFQ